MGCEWDPFGEEIGSGIIHAHFSSVQWLSIRWCSPASKPDVILKFAYELPRPRYARAQRSSGQTGDGRWRGSIFGTELRSKLRGEEGELLSGAGTRRRAQGRARGLSGDHRRRRGVVEATASAIQSVNSLKGASAVPLSHTELSAERATITPSRQEGIDITERASTTLPIPGINNSPPHTGHQQFPPIRAERAPGTPTVPLPNRGANRETRACAENAGESSPATPGARSQAQLR